MQNKGKLLCLDLGKKVGIAISDSTWTLARGIKTVNIKDLKIELKKIINQEKICGLVIGLPINMDGTPAKSSEETIQFGEELSKEFNLIVKFQDERLSSWAARELLHELGYKADKIRALEDQTAAKIILESFLKSDFDINIFH